MAKIVVVGCKLPHGVILEHPMDPTKKVELAGKNKALIVGADYASTEVDADFWEQWAAVNKEFPAVNSGAIFVAKSAADIVAVARENADRKTGFEAMDPKSHGVKPADKD